jgi:type IV pilus assembly protein PilC
LGHYKYKAKDSEGHETSGVIAANDEAQALSELRAQNLIVTDITQTTAEDTSNLDMEISFSRGVPAETLSTFLLQLSIMIKCGVSLSEALQSLEHGEENKNFKKILGEVRNQVYGGRAFSDALGAHPDVFDKFTVAMIRVGETGGVLEQVLIKLSSSSKRRMALKNQIIGALAYPSILLLVASVVLIVLMGFAVPQFASMFLKAGLDLPIATRILIQISNFLSQYVVQVLITGAVLFVAFVMFLFTENGRNIVTEISLKLPIIQKVTQRYFVVQISESMGLLLGAGVPLRELIMAIENTVSVPTPKAVLIRMRDSIDQGASLKQSLENGPIFPPMAVKLVETGEMTGTLDNMFGEIATYYDDQLQAAIRSVLSMLEPMLIAGMACLVGFIMLAVFVPLFQMSFMKPK